MRYIKRPETKKSYQWRVGNKKKSRSRNMRGLKNNVISSCSLNLDNLSEVVRHNMLRQADGRGLWKVLPRDSCEVYRNRNQRNRDGTAADTSYEMSEEKNKDRYKKKQKRNVPRKRKKAPVKKVKPCKYKKRRAK